MKDRYSIVKRILSYVNDRYDKTKGLFFYDATKPVSIEMENTYKEIEIAAGKIDVENLSGIELERFVEQRTGIERKTATFATTEVVIKGQVGTEINKGILVASDTVNYVVANNAVIGKDGQATVIVVSEKAGTIGNIIAGSIKLFPITIPGLTSVINLKDIENGYEAETDTSLLTRYYERIRTPATSGNIYHYKNWAKEVEGVGDAKIVPLWNGNGTVKVVIIDSNKEIANESIINKVQEYIDPGKAGLGEGQAPIGATTTVVSAKAKNISVRANVSVANGLRIQDVQQEFTKALESYRQEHAFKDNYVSYSAMNNVLFNTEGVLDSNNLTLNSKKENVSLAEDEIAIFKLVELELM